MAKSYHATSATPDFGRRATRRSFQRPTQKVQVYDCLEAAGKNGLPAVEIAAKTGIPLDRVRFHLSELKRSGYVAVLGDPTTVSVTMSPDDAAFAAMLGLENALIARVRHEKVVSPEVDKCFLIYNKCKELALRPGTNSEGRTALRMALINLVKAVF